MKHRYVLSNIFALLLMLSATSVFSQEKAAAVENKTQPTQQEQKSSFSPAQKDSSSSFSSEKLAQSAVPEVAPIPDAPDRRFDAVRESWTTPSLGTSHLIPVSPLSSGIQSFDAYNYTMEAVRVQWRGGDPIDLYIMKPTGVEKPPVVLYLYGYESDTYRFLNEGFQQAVTKDGFAAVGFVSALSGQRYHDRPMKEWFVSELQESLAVSAHDVQMVLDFLAARGDFDMTRVGMFATDSGASIAILASAVDPRIKVLDLVDPWGDWPDWLANSPIVPDAERKDLLKPDFLSKVADLDPVQWLPKVQAKKLRLQDAVFAKSTPKSAKDKLRAAVPVGTAVVVYKTPEETKSVLEGSNVLLWIQNEIKSLPRPDTDMKVADHTQTAAPAASSK